MKEKLEQILNYGKKAIVTGLTLTLIGLTTPYCGNNGNGGNGDNGPTPTVYQCNNSIDDDGDTLIDLNDPGCSSSTDNSEYNPPTNQAPVINSKNVQYTQPETSQNIKYTANVTDPNDNLSTVVLELSTDGINYAQYTMTSTGSNNYEYNKYFDDGAVVSARIRATDSQGLDTVSTFTNLSVYLSETDGQNAILSSTTGLKTNPLETLVDQNHTFFNTYLIDVVLKFQGPLGAGGIRYDNTYDCTTAKVPLTFVSRTDELTPTQLSDLKAELSVWPYCGIGVLRTPYAFIDYIDYDNPPSSGTPTTKTDIAGIVSSLLTAEDLKINYKPIADAGIDDLGNIAGLSTVGLDGSGSSDSDGTIVFCEWDYEGDGIYDWNSNLTCSTTRIYPSPEGYNAKLRITDDEGTQSTDTKFVEVN